MPCSTNCKRNPNHNSRSTDPQNAQEITDEQPDPQSRSTWRPRDRHHPPLRRARRLVFDAFTKPELLKRWLTGPPGWSLPVCEIDLRVGGALRYLWRGPAGEQMGMSGVFREITPPDRIVSTEKFDQPWYPGEGVGTVVLTEQRGQTTLTQTIVYESRGARDGVLKSPMEQGLGMSYDHLADLLVSLANEKSRRSA